MLFAIVISRKDVRYMLKIANEEKLIFDMLNVLKSEVKPALGCTEPVALGIAVAEAYRVVRGQLHSIDIKMSPNIYKNGLGVGIPGTEEKGLLFAVALGITCGDSSLGLEVFRNVNAAIIEESKKLLKRDIIRITIEDRLGNFYIKAEVHTDKGKGLCVIKDSHTNIVLVKENEEIIFQKEEDKDAEEGNSYGNLKEYCFSDIRTFVENAPYNEIEFLLEGVKLNMDIAKIGLSERSGPGLGATLKDLMSEGIMQNDLINEARILTSAACDARMAGVNMAVMSSAGSGNHGITAIIPPTVIAEHMGFDQEKLARTLAFSHLTTSYIKIYTGRLSPVCGCAVAAGIGASSSITWALGGTDKQIYGAIKNMVASLSGMVCDGAKGGCSFKLSTAASEAIVQSKLALANVFVSDLDGIVGQEVESTIRNLGKFCTQGMKLADNNIIEIMLRK